MDREQLKEELGRLLKSSLTDAVKLAGFDQEERPRLEELDLSGVVELKRSEKGCFEVKFIDKLKAAELLERLCAAEDDGGLEQLLNCLTEGDER